MNKVSLISLNKPGFEAAEKTAEDLLKLNEITNISIYHKSGIAEKKLNFVCYKEFETLDKILAEIWTNSDAIIWFASTGIVVRKIAPFLVSKTTDPAILVMNMDRTQVIPLLSGHIGGANELAVNLSRVNGNLTPFITTATDSLNIFAFDNFAKNHGFEILNIEKLAQISNTLINGGKINVITYESIKNILLDEGLNMEQFDFYHFAETYTIRESSLPTVLITPYEEENITNAFKIRVKPLVLGIGLRKSVEFAELKDNFDEFMFTNNLQECDIKVLASFEAKREEEALLELASCLGVEVLFYEDHEINDLNEDFTDSRAMDKFNIKGVAEPCAILAAPNRTLFIKKKSFEKVTIAAAF